MHYFLFSTHLFSAFCLAANCLLFSIRLGQLAPVADREKSFSHVSQITVIHLTSIHHHHHQHCHHHHNISLLSWSTVIRYWSWFITKTHRPQLAKLKSSNCGISSTACFLMKNTKFGYKAYIPSQLHGALLDLAIPDGLSPPQLNFPTDHFWKPVKPTEQLKFWAKPTRNHWNEWNH